MKFHTKTLLAAGLLAGGLAAQTALAGEITLYQHSNYGGNQITLRSEVPALGDVGFSDSASSIVVHSGNWQVCTDGAFAGYCEQLAPGEYPRLDRRINNRIASLREVGDFRRDGAPGPRVHGRGSIQFFDQPGFRGSVLALERDAPNFVERGYNDRAESIVIDEGVWELCSDINYAGDCRLFGPGRYVDLGPGMANRLSSARLVRNAGDAAMMRGGWGRAPAGDNGRSRVILFTDEGLRGRSLAISDTAANLQYARFNDAAASMLVEGGPWLACSDAYFRGTCRVFGPGRYDQLRDPGLSHVISSLRPTRTPPG